MKFKVNHLGIIPDGGRRWARQHGVSLRSSYDLTMQLLRSTIARFFEHGGTCASVYLFSVDNFKRPSNEVADALDAEAALLRDLIQDQVSLDTNLVVAGRMELLPPIITQANARIENQADRSRTVFLCLAYDPWSELTAALENKNVSEGFDIVSALWINKPVDLLLRSGGAKTLSKFLPLQCAHARLIFMDALFNDLTEENVLEQVRQHEAQDLLFGE